MAPTLGTLMSLGSKNKEPGYICLSEAKASHSHKICSEVSSSVPHFLQVGLLLSPITHRSTEGSCVPSSKFQMAPRLKILMTAGSKKGTQIYFSYLTKVPANEPPPGSPNTAPIKREAHLQGICISLRNLIFRIPQ